MSWAYYELWTLSLFNFRIYIITIKVWRPSERKNLLLPQNLMSETDEPHKTPLHVVKKFVKSRPYNWIKTIYILNHIYLYLAYTSWLRCHSFDSQFVSGNCRACIGVYLVFMFLLEHCSHWLSWGQGRGTTRGLC